MIRALEEDTEEEDTMTTVETWASQVNVVTEAVVDIMEAGIIIEVSSSLYYKTLNASTFNSAYFRNRN